MNLVPNDFTETPTLTQLKNELFCFENFINIQASSQQMSTHYKLFHF